MPRGIAHEGRPATHGDEDGAAEQVASSSSAEQLSRDASAARAPTYSIPRQPSLVCVEYPGVLCHGASSLERALRSLHPAPPQLASAHEALRHLGRLVAQQRRRPTGQNNPHAAAAKSAPGVVVECRLTPSTFGEAYSVDADLFRHPVPGELVDTYNPVMRIRKRIWRRARTQDRGTTAARGAGGDEGDGPQDDVRKEYTVEILGSVRHTVRFRSLADYAFCPQTLSEPPRATAAASVERERARSAAEDGNGGRDARKGADATPLTSTMDLYRALVTMDVDALRRFTLAAGEEEAEEEDPEARTPDGAWGPVPRGKKGRGSARGGPTTPAQVRRRSNLRLFPPPQFSHQVAPFVYGFRQNPGSTLVRAEDDPRGLGPLRDDGTRSRARYANRALTVRGLAPLPHSMTSTADVPKRPSDLVERMRPDCDAGLLARLKELFDGRPIWTRLALLNQLPPEWRRETFNQKQYLALSCYAMVDGPWRDCLVRFGYDVRSEPESRFYQKVMRRARGRRSALATRRPRGPPQRGGSAGQQPVEAEAEAATTSAAQSASAWAADGEKNSHVFDGLSLVRSTGTYQLCDVVDELVAVHVRQGGVRDEVDLTTGWFEARDWDVISEVFALRYHALVERGEPATPVECARLVRTIYARWGEPSGGGGGGAAAARSSRPGVAGGDGEEGDEEHARMEEEGDEKDDDAQDEL